MPGQEALAPHSILTCQELPITPLGARLAPASVSVGTFGDTGMRPAPETTRQAFEPMPDDIIFSGTPENVGLVVTGDTMQGAVAGLPTLNVTVHGGMRRFGTVRHDASPAGQRDQPACVPAPYGSSPNAKCRAR